MIRFKPGLTLLVVLLTVGCSKPADKKGGADAKANGEVTTVAFDIKGMT